MLYYRDITTSWHYRPILGRLLRLHPGIYRNVQL